jgi:pimeloyl-ACP methyl ester carboxylesterase
MEVLHINGLRIAFRRQGAGPPLVLIHGGLSDSRQWRRQLEALSAAFTVVAWDAPGCGQSSDPPEHFRLADYADCLAAWIAALGLEQPHVLGLSFGGGLALELYQRHPTVPRTLVLASAYAGWAGSLPQKAVADRLQQGLRQAELPPEDVARAWLPSLFSDPAPIELVAETAAIMAAFHPVGMRVMLQAFAEADLRPVLPRIAVPTLLLYGDADRRSPPSIADELHAQIPTSTLVVMPGVGHLSNVEAPERFNAEVRRFLTAHQA